MKTDEIKLFYNYNYWADQRILAVCADVSEEQYTASTSYGNLRDTVIHILDTEWGWRLGYQRHFVTVDALKENPPVKLWESHDLTVADVPTLAAVQERWQAEHLEMQAYLDGLCDQDLDGLVRYLVPEGMMRERVLWHCLVHVVNHGTQHRSEAAALLTSYGHSPGGLDFTAFLNGHFHMPT